MSVKTYQVPVLITVKAQTPEAAQVRTQDWLHEVLKDVVQSKPDPYASVADVLPEEFEVGKAKAVTLVPNPDDAEFKRGHAAAVAAFLETDLNLCLAWLNEKLKHYQLNQPDSQYDYGYLAGLQAADLHQRRAHARLGEVHPL